MILKKTPAVNIFLDMSVLVFEMLEIPIVLDASVIWLSSEIFLLSKHSKFSKTNNYKLRFNSPKQTDWDLTKILSIDFVIKYYVMHESRELLTFYRLTDFYWGKAIKGLTILITNGQVVKGHSGIILFYVTHFIPFIKRNSYLILY